MSTWVTQVSSSHKIQLVATAVLSGVLVGAAILGLQTAKRQYKINDLKDSIPSLREEHDVVKVPSRLCPTLPVLTDQI